MLLVWFPVELCKKKKKIFPVYVSKKVSAISIPKVPAVLFICDCFFTFSHLRSKWFVQLFHMSLTPISKKSNDFNEPSKIGMLL